MVRKHTCRRNRTKTRRATKKHRGGRDATTGASSVLAQYTGTPGLSRGGSGKPLSKHAKPFVSKIKHNKKLKKTLSKHAKPFVSKIKHNKELKKTLSKHAKPFVSKINHNKALEEIATNVAEVALRNEPNNRRGIIEQSTGNAESDAILKELMYNNPSLTRNNNTNNNNNSKNNNKNNKK